MGRTALHAWILLLLSLAVSAWGQAGDDASLKFFDPSNKILEISNPILIGVDRFSARIEAVRRSGREPLGLVLSGGSARAYAHIGVLEVLEKNGIVPDFIVANSMGAVIGLLYAAGLSPDSIASLMERLPPESLIDPVFPTKGGLLNADRLEAAVRFTLGDLKLEDLPLPILVTMEDLESRRHVEIAAGDFAGVFSAVFALPGIFEPNHIEGMALIDGGVTNLVPVADAARFSGSLIVSTALYDRDLSYANPVTVINRAIDIGKTRAALSELAATRPAVIRNDVENLSFMSFSDPAAIIERGRVSAEKALPIVLETLGPGAGAGTISAEMAAARIPLGVKVERALIDLNRGVRAPVDPSLRFKLRVKFLDNYDDPVPGREGLHFAGLGADFATGKIRIGLSAFAGIGMPPEKAWGLGVAFSTGLVDSLMFEADARLFGEFPESGSVPDPKLLELAAALHWDSGGEKVSIKPHISFESKMSLPSWTSDWRSVAGAETTFKTDPSAGFAFVTSLDAGGFADSELSAGPEWIATANAFWSGVGRISARTTGRWDLCGAGTEIRFGDAYRGIQPAGKGVFRSVLNIEAAWSAKILGFDVSEMVIVKDIEVGPYMDFAWFGPSATIVPRPGAIVTGLVASATASFVGLAPLDVSAFAGFDFSGSAVIGISAGRLFKSGGSNATGLPSAHRVDGSSDQSLKRTPIVENP